MVPFSWRQWWSKLSQATQIRRKRSGDSTRLMEVELLENRLVPANIYVTGSVTTMIAFTDPARFKDGAEDHVSHPVAGGNFVAMNLRSAVYEATQNLTGANTIILETSTTPANTYQLSGELGEIKIKFAADTKIKPNNLTITNGQGGISTIDAATFFPSHKTLSNSRHFEVYGGGMTTLDHLKLIDGKVGPHDPTQTSRGGSIFNHGNLTLTNDLITGNTAYGGSNVFFTRGGAIYNTFEATLTMNNDQVTYNIATGMNAYGSTEGGGLFNQVFTTLKITNTTFDHNIAKGGVPNAINTFSTGGEGRGGGAYIQGGNGIGTVTATIMNTTFSNNQALGGNVNLAGAEGQGGKAFGGGLTVGGEGVNVNIINTTFAKNTAYGGAAGSFGNTSYSGGKAYGGAIHVDKFNKVNLVNDTIAFNTVISGRGAADGSFGTAYGGGVSSFDPATPVVFLIKIRPFRDFSARVELVNTIIAKNTFDRGSGPSTGARSDVSGGFFSQGHNLIGNVDGSTGGGFGAPGDQLGHTGALIDPGLDPNGLQYNGGPTQTIALIKGSRAIDTGDDTFGGFTPAPTTDQRGLPRKSGPHVDIGAYEFQYPTSGSHGRDYLYDLLFGFSSTVVTPTVPTSQPG